MGEWFGRIRQRVKRTPDLRHRLCALSPHQAGTNNRGQNNDAQRAPQANRAANLDEKGDLDQRNADEQGQKPHTILISCIRGAVDLPPLLPYIRSEQNRNQHFVTPEV